METDFPGGRNLISEALKRKDVPLAAVDICVKSILENTLKQYDSSLKRWWNFCLKNGLDVFNSSARYVLEFFACEFDRGASFGTLNSYQAAAF